MFKIYTKGYCPYCKFAKMFLQSNHYEFEEFSLESNPDLQKEIFEQTNRRTVPQIFYKDTHIGGYDDLVSKSKSGILAEIIQSK